jgi:hypothetical protein
MTTEWGGENPTAEKEVMETHKAASPTGKEAERQFKEEWLCH